MHPVGHFLIIRIPRAAVGLEGGLKWLGQGAVLEDQGFIGYRVTVYGGPAVAFIVASLVRLLGPHLDLGRGYFLNNISSLAFGRDNDLADKILKLHVFSPLILVQGEGFGIGNPEVAVSFKGVDDGLVLIVADVLLGATLAVDGDDI